MNNLSSIKKLIVDDADYWGAPMSEGRLQAFANQLQSYDPKQIYQAMLHFHNEPGRTRMPMPADLIAQMKGGMDSDTKGKLAASRTIEAISRFGYANPEAAKEFIGELGWSAVKRYGGWSYVCENLGVNIPVATFQAQIRDICIATDKAGKAGLSDAPIAISAPEPKREIAGPERVDAMKLLNNVRSKQNTEEL